MSHTPPQPVSDTMPRPEPEAARQPSHLAVAARARMVNRTHRVVRERAQDIRSRRSRIRSLSIPLAISSAFVVILCTAIWSLLDQYELAPTGIPDASSQIFIFLLWFFPCSAALLALVWARGNNANPDSTR